MRPLARLQDIARQYGGDAAARKSACLGELERAALPSARAVLLLHEILCFLRAYPDDAALLARVTAMLERFSRRADMRRHAARLADSGVAGSAIHFPFFADTAAWLALRFPRDLQVDWDAVEEETEQRLLDRLDLLVRHGETPLLDEEDHSLRRWLELLCGPREADGAFVARRFAALEAAPALRESLYDELALPLLLRPAPGTPSRTLAHTPLAGSPPTFQREPLRRERPDLRRTLRKAPRVRALTRAGGAELIALAREAMVTRARDLDVFVYGDPNDVRLVECGDGLAFAAIGFRPERRLLLEAVYGFLTLKNGVPIGYVLNSALFGSAEVAFNVFETFRGGEAAHVYGQVLASVRALFGVDTFTIYPYQLGQENDEALDSGAWWFYQRLGFRPRDRGALALMRRELSQAARHAGHRSTRSTLKRLADHNLYYSLGRARSDVIGEVSLSGIGAAASRLLAERYGSERERGERECAAEAARRFDVASTARWSAGERLAWQRWSPLFVLLAGVERWSLAEKRAAVAAVRAKGGRRETDFVRRFDAHKKLRAALLRLARG